LELKRRLEVLQQKLLKHVDDFIVNELETSDGYIKRDGSKISKFQQSMDDFFDENNIAFLAFMVASLEKLLKSAAGNFKKDGAEYDDVKYMLEILGVKNGVVQKKRNSHPTVLYAIASMSVIKIDIINKMQGAFIGDVAIKDFRKAVEGSVRRKYHDFFEVNSVAALFNTYNAANRFFAKKYNYTKFRYEGGLIADSRDFCVERDGNEFFIEEGERWNEYEWKGKIPGVDFFVQVGGYNCRHWLTYIK
jgi:hypothetical protein